ncbi:hypothetical protein CHLRE_06g284600v5 [Chlamydomonas reinhardtii]|uniref:Uncharacterized protein n=1 Tax=Chlamydomonas reinhardtii TaxID=3055 RepID=A8J276_CHLRE|nr:uncharacterized protein CHLRE_06g284600v5 [Chlamydomonas reinhardtii]PNW82575.1 hypothetical protein CHLRE_06g284600v5 [Chlamydomonas reinhardtii]|eukprot:XP_001695348.1 rubredoxin [Chlamydomonas reinhardtii]
MAMLAQRQAFSGVRVAPKAPVVAARISRSTVKTQALFGFGAKPAASGGAAAPAFMICIDCGYIYDGGQEFKSLPGSYKCPVCSSPKSRFKVYKGTDVKGKPNNAPATMKKRKDAKQW